MKAGPLRNRVVVQGLVETRDTYGQMVQSWINLSTVWAEVRFLSGREAVNAKQIKAEISHAITMRYVGPLFSAPGLLPSMRLSFNGKLFNIININNVDERNREYRLLAAELPPGTPTS